MKLTTPIVAAALAGLVWVPVKTVLNRRGADERRERLLRDIPTRDGFDRDEYPPAVGGGAGRGSSAAATRAAGRRTSATCPPLRTDRTARRSETSSRTSATARAFRYVFH